MKRFLQQWPILIAGMLVISGASAATLIARPTLFGPKEPNRVGGLQMWLKADAIEASDGDSISTWSDSSGHGNDMTGSTAPTFSAHALNGHPVVTFSSLQSLKNTTLDLPDSWTVIYVARLTGGIDRRILQGVSNNWLLGTWGGQVNDAYFDGDVHLFEHPGDTADTKWRIYEGTSDGTTASFYSNGALIDTSENHAPPVGGLAINDGNLPDESSNAQVAEILAYDNDISASDRVQLESYLSAKYGIRLDRSAGTTVQAAPTNGLVGYWPLGPTSISGTTAADASPTHSNGTLATTASFESGPNHNALVFDGSTQKVTVPNFSAQIAGKSALTITGWVKPGAPQAGHAAYFGMRGDDTGDFYVLQLSGTTNLECRFSNSDGTVFQPDADPIITSNVWQFVSFVYDGSSVHCSVNGVTQSGSASGLITATNLPLMIGTDNNENNFTGDIEDVRVYDRALSDQELGAIRGSLQTTVNASQNSRVTNGLVGLWSFDGPDMNWGTNTALDRSGSGNNGQLYGFSTSTSPVSGKLGQALRFNGSSYITTGYSVPAQDSSSSFTWSVWAKLDADNPVNAVVLGFRTGDTWIKLTPTKFEYVDGADSSTAIPVGQWVHVAVVKDESSITYYLNGAEASSVGDVRSTGTGTFYIGEDPTSPDDGAIKGELDDVRVYNRALSPAEVRALYLIGK